MGYRSTMAAAHLLAMAVALLAALATAPARAAEACPCGYIPDLNVDPTGGIFMCNTGPCPGNYVAPTGTTPARTGSTTIDVVAAVASNGASFQRLDDPAAIPSGYRTATCQEVMVHLGVVLKVLNFEDVCYAHGGAIRGTRADNSRGNSAYCDSSKPQETIYTCHIITDLPEDPADKATTSPASPQKPVSYKCRDNPRVDEQYADEYMLVRGGNTMPAGFQLATCSQALAVLDKTPVGFSDVCSVAGGSMWGPRVDGPGLKMACPDSSSLQANCYIAVKAA